MASTSSTTTPFKPSAQLQTKAPTAKAVASSLPHSGASNASEARYWAEKFGLGTSSAVFKVASQSKYAHFRQVHLQAGTAAICHQLEFGPSSIKKSSTAPLATVCGPRVQLYGTTLQSPLHKTLSRHALPEKIEGEKVNLVAPDRQVQTGGHLALAASFRSDGRLLAIGCHNGQIRVADTTSRATMCTWQASTLPCRSVQWFRNGQHVLATADDGLVTVWRLKQQQLGSSSSSSSGASAALVTCRGHGDAVRCAALWQLPAKTKHSWPVSAMAASGSYDKTVRLWNMDDLETVGDEGSSNGRLLAVLSHGSPVEAVLWMPASESAAVPAWLVSAGGTTVKVWNPLTGVCVSTTNTLHRKTITCLLAAPRKDYKDDGSGMMVLHNRILTGSIDGLVRVHAWNDDRSSSSPSLRHLHGINLRQAVTAMAMTANADRLAIALVDGSVLVRQRGPSLTEHKRKRPPPAGTYAFFTRGMNVEASTSDYVVEASGKKKKLQPFDLALKQFRYGDALDESLETRNPMAVVAVLEELGKRRGLTIALSNRDEESLEPLLSFTVRYICRPRFAPLLIGVAHKLIDIYGGVAGQSETIDELFVKLQKQVSAECKAQKTLMQIVGQLDGIMAAAQMSEQGY